MEVLVKVDAFSVIESNLTGGLDFSLFRIAAGAKVRSIVFDCFFEFLAINICQQIQ